MDGSWLEKYAITYGERIVKGKKSNARIASMTGLPLPYAQALAAYCRRREMPDASLMTLPDLDALKDDLEGLPEKSKPVPAPVSAEESEPEEDNYDRLLLDQDYIYNEESDTYITFLPSVPRPIVLPGTVHRELVRGYSNFDGKPATVNELARTFKMPPQWITKYLRVHRITHDREPFTPEEIMTRSDEDLAEEALQIRRAAVYKKLESEKWRDIQKDALKYRGFESRVLSPFKEWLENFAPAYEPPDMNLDLEVSDHAVVICPTDFHWGKYAWEGETGDSYNREIAKDRLLYLMSKVLERCLRWGVPSVIYLGLGSDFGHADTDGHTTTRGTPQDMDGTLFEMIKTGFELSVLLVDILRGIAPVHVVALQNSNHDKLFAQYQLHYLDAWYRNQKDVSVNVSCKPRQYEKFGKTIMMFTHGDGVKLTHLPEIMAVEKSKDWGACPHRVAFTGHCHHEKTLGLRGMTVYQLWSMAGTDRWHARQGYVGSPKGLAAHIVDRNEGIVGSVSAPVIKENEEDAE
jgi:hypothetical protein